MFKIEKSWKEALAEEIEQPYFEDLKEFLRGELSRGKEIYPRAEQIFAALEHTPFDSVKVVILGQDPYHGPSQANGLAFSVEKGLPIPPSLRNIYKELVVDLGVPFPPHGSLRAWADQGVLLLNATLTVERGRAKSHYGKGWERFTDAIIEKLALKKDPLVFILWGRIAEEKCERILEKKKHSHVVLKASHPSPFSASGFFGSKPFSKANEFLKQFGKKPIDWKIV